MIRSRNRDPATPHMRVYVKLTSRQWTHLSRRYLTAITPPVAGRRRRCRTRRLYRGHNAGKQDGRGAEKRATAPPFTHYTRSVTGTSSGSSRPYTNRFRVGICPQATKRVTLVLLCELNVSWALTICALTDALPVLAAVIEDVVVNAAVENFVVVDHSVGDVVFEGGKNAGKGTAQSKERDDVTGGRKTRGSWGAGGAGFLQHLCHMESRSYVGIWVRRLLAVFTVGCPYRSTRARHR